VALALDLSQSEAKVTCARKHVKALGVEMAEMTVERSPYCVRVAEIDPDTGNCSIFLSPKNLDEPTLGLIAGDVIHSLRCALDYLVTALVCKSGAGLTTRHQFPIFDEKRDYERAVGNASSVKGNGMLGGVTHGLRVFWDLQPFNAKPGPEDDFLFHINRFSNADKHRVITALAPIPQHIHWDFAYSGILEETLTFPKQTGIWEPNVEYEFARLRFARPFPVKPDAKAEITVAVLFSTPPFGKDKKGRRISAKVLGEMCDYVAVVVNRFKTLAWLIAHSAALVYLWQVNNCRTI
jgi:hypothetical protein